MKQYRITTANIDYPQENDCVLVEDDPVNLIRKSLLLGGLGNGIGLNKLPVELLEKYWNKEGD